MNHLKRSDIAEKYFNNLEIVKHGNLGLISLLSKIQIALNEGSIDKNKCILVVEDIKAVLYNDDIKKKEIMESFRRRF